MVRYALPGCWPSFFDFFLPIAFGDGEVARRAGGVMSSSRVAYDPSARCAGTSPRGGVGRNLNYQEMRRPRLSAWLLDPVLTSPS